MECIITCLFSAILLYLLYKQNKNNFRLKINYNIQTNLYGYIYIYT